MKTDNIPTIQPASTRAVFGAQDVQNSFQAAINKQNDINYQNYLKSKQK